MNKIFVNGAHLHNRDSEVQSKKIFVCFTCERDLPLLNAHFAAIRHTEPNAVVYYVFADGEKSQAPEGSYMLNVDFPRNGNLMGVQCHYGMLSTMQQLSEMNDKCDVVKIDSDCFYIHDFPDGYEMVGTAPGMGYYCKGCCYKISYNCVLKRTFPKKPHYVS